VVGSALKGRHAQSPTLTTFALSSGVQSAQPAPISPRTTRTPPTLRSIHSRRGPFRDRAQPCSRAVPAPAPAPPAPPPTALDRNRIRSCSLLALTGRLCAASPSPVARIPVAVLLLQRAGPHPLHQPRPACLLAAPGFVRALCRITTTRRRCATRHKP
jgi:hypothetical protein